MTLNCYKIVTSNLCTAGRVAIAFESLVVIANVDIFFQLELDVFFIFNACVWECCVFLTFSIVYPVRVCLSLRME